MKDLPMLRQQISSLDSELLRLLGERMEVAREIGVYKISENLPIIDEVREQEILSKIPKSYRNLWDEMMETSKRKQYEITQRSSQKIAIQGGKGSFNEIAIRHFLSAPEHRLLRTSQGLEHENTEIVYAYTTAEVLKMVARGEVEYGQFAIANSIGGLVQETLDALGSKRWNYIAHYAIPVKHCLMIHPDTTIENITTIMGHEQAVRQCEQTLNARFPNISKVGGTGDLTDNASVAEGVANGKLPRTTASIGHESLAMIYDLKIIERDIQDRDDNMTTFVLIQGR